MQTELSRMNVLRLSNEESNRVTREALQIAMMKLMTKTPFDKITVSDIAKRAGVSRAGFYRNYDSKETLVEEICRAVFAKLDASIKSEKFQNDRQAWYTTFFQTVKENREYFQLYLDARLQIGDQVVLESVYPSTSVQEHYLHAAREGAFVNILRDWFSSGMHETPEDIGKITYAILAPLEMRDL